MEQYSQFVQHINVNGYRFGESDTSLLIEDHGDVVITYAPFDHVNPGAELVLVGLTPGREQAANAIGAYQDAIRAGKTHSAALAEAKATASFSGPMRRSLIDMLDDLKVASHFNRSSAVEFFESRNDIVHFTSALRYPVYLPNGDNYSGSPGLLRHHGLKRMVDGYLAEEALTLPRAFWVPLGAHAEAALAYLVKGGKLDRRRVLTGLPHPSGANAERIAYFLGRKARGSLSSKTNPDRIEAAKLSLKTQLAGLSA